MIKRLTTRDPDFTQQLAALLAFENAQDETIERAVAEILTAVRTVGDAAVLETAINSDLPGSVRAVVSRDVRSFDGSRVLIAGAVTHRQRPATAGGTMFINLEDETGLINIVCSLGCWTRYRVVARRAPALLVRGRLERAEGVVNVIAHSIHTLPVAAANPSRDFR